MFKPTSPERVFQKLGQRWVQKSLLNGEFKRPLDAQAKLWLEHRHQACITFWARVNAIVAAIGLLSLIGTAIAVAQALQ